MLCSRDSTMSADRFHCEQDENKSGKSVPLRAHSHERYIPNHRVPWLQYPQITTVTYKVRTSYICIQDTNCTPAPAPARMLNHVTWRDRPAGHVVNYVPTQTATCWPNCHMRRQVSNMHDCDIHLYKPQTRGRTRTKPETLVATSFAIFRFSRFEICSAAILPFARVLDLADIFPS